MSAIATVSAVRERPILFSGEMVRAILEGRKTQTRRVIKPQPEGGYLRIEQGTERQIAVVNGSAQLIGCPYGKAGDRLWVRESFAELIATSPATDRPLEITEGEKLIEPPTSWEDGQGRTRWNYDGKVVAYRANSKIEFCDGDGFIGDSANRNDMPRWRSPIHMPRWACRILLEIKNVRIERIQQITPDDCAHEGSQYPVTTERMAKGKCAPLLQLGGKYSACQYLDKKLADSKKEADVHAAYSRAYFASLWDSINAKRGFSWDSNPWVWVIEFRRVQP